MKNFKILKLLIVFLIFIVVVYCDSNSKKEIKYMATTKWVASIVEIGGLDNVESFAPSDMVHPPEYELKPDDIDNLTKAEIVFYAGYEQKMVEKINESLKNSKNDFEIVKITTENSLENIKTEAKKVAEKFNTLDNYERNIEQIENTYNEIRDTLRNRDLYRKNAYVHVFQLPLAKSLEFNIVGTYGPAPVSAEQIQEVSDLKPDIIIDNFHNEVGSPLKEVSAESLYLSFINFPGMFNTRSINDVLLYAKHKIEEVEDK